MINKRINKPKYFFALTEMIILLPFMVLLFTIFESIVNSKPGPARTYLEIGNHILIPNIDVYCNDVHLGKTPFTLSVEEIRRKVEARTQPPRQEYVIEANGVKQQRVAANETSHLNSDQPNRFPLKRMLNSPQDIKLGLRPSWQSHLRDEEEMQEYLSSAKYWWRFEKSGCMALQPLRGSGYSGGGNNYRYTISPHFDFEFPSIKPHLRLLMIDLQKQNYAPSQAWIDHFLNYSDLLFLELYKKAQTNPRLEPVLQTLVKAKYDMHDEMTPADYKRVIDAILNRVEAQGGFRLPSLESLAMEMIAKPAADIIVAKYDSLMDEVYSSSRGRRGNPFDANGCVLHREGKANRKLPLEHAIRRITPPALYNRLVYEYAKTKDRTYYPPPWLHLIGNYRRPETKRLFDDIYRDIVFEHNMTRHGIEQFISNTASLIVNPQLEERFRHIIREHGTNRSPHYDYMFLRSRINNPHFGQNQLATWIFHWAPLKEREKREYLLKIHSDKTYHYLKILRFDSLSVRENMIYALQQNPNPYLDQFLIDSYEFYHSPKGPGYGYGNLIHA
ncbi:hypothetical protein GF373_17015, partial [bacterium]|nr:hypothetical protein [bacterium]